MKLPVSVLIGCLLTLPSQLLAQGATVPKTNPIPVYVQVMPWFQTPETLGGTNWGWHWTMNDRNPNIIDANGQREIASNYYPLIGTYDSSDPNVIEYQMLLMKVSGISGTIVDWYGQQGSNGDEASLLNASNKIVSATQTYGLGVGVCLEDRFATSTSEVTNNINYMETNYATQSNYIRMGANKQPLTMLFGPITYQQPSQWTTILSGVNQQPALVPLQYQASQVGSAASGEMGWIYEDHNTTDNLTVQQNFLANEAGKFSNSIGDAYVGYNDYYAAGGDPSAAAGFVIPETQNGVSTLTATLNQDQTYSKNIAAIQVATWNDYGEGTMIEPTVQNGFSSLQQIQKFTGVSYGLSQLQLVYQLYEARTELAGNTSAQTVLNQVSSDINNLDFTDATSSLGAALESAPATIGDINALTLNGTAALDLTNHHIIITYAGSSDPIATIRAYLQSGYNGGTWTGLGIQSSSAAANPLYSLGYADDNDPGNPAGLAPGQIKIMYTLLGDANLDGEVNSIDFAILATNFNKAVSGWDQGDFNYDGSVNSIDFADLAENFNQGASQADLAALNAFAAANGLLANVPEPASTSLLLIAAAIYMFASHRRAK